jgi:hypothetical protein
MAVQGGAGLDQLERLMALQERWEANEARKAFNKAFAAFKAEAVEIVKGTTIKDGPLKGKKHANLDDVVSAVTPKLSEHGLSAAWKLTTDEKDWMVVTCTLSHEAGHFESVSMGGMPDSGPGRNAIQARGSVKTYLERYTLTAILGLAARDADDDGAGGNRDKRGRPDVNTATAAEPSDELLQSGRDASMLGMKALTAWWAALTGAQRESLTADFGAMRKAASAADKMGAAK